MRQSEFISLCNEHNVTPAQALRNDDIVKALRERDDDRVRDIIQNEL